MNLRDLRYLVALSEYRHFGRAAEACFVSQPTLSVQIAKLEAELGVQLFERSSRKLLLTDIGAQIVERAQNVLHEVDQIRYLARNSLDPESGSLLLGIIPTLAPYLLPHVLGTIHRRFPRLELLLIEEKTHELVDRLRRGKLDAAVLALPVHDDTLHSVDLFEEPFLLATPDASPLADKRGIGRYGHAVVGDGARATVPVEITLPMDETLARAALDCSGRACFVFDGRFPRESVGGVSTEMVPHFFRSLCDAAGFNLHLAVRGENTHHMVEACFKAVARALRVAIRREGRELPSTKGRL